MGLYNEDIMKKTPLFILSILFSFTLFMSYGLSTCERIAQTTVTQGVTEEAIIKQDIVNNSILIISNRGTGSGVIFSQDKHKALIITARHVVMGKKDFFGRQELDGKLEFEPLTLLCEFESSDIAILSSKPVWTSACRVIPNVNSLILYSKAMTFGFPANMGSVVDGVLTEGRISKLNDIGFTGSFKTLTSVPVSFGNSGGGLFVMVEGHWCLAGILTNVYAIGSDHEQIVHHISAASTAEQLFDALRAYRK